MLKECSQCGEELVPPEDIGLWDRRTELVDGREMVVERSVNVSCGKCGATDAATVDESGNWRPAPNAHLFVVAVDPEPLPSLVEDEILALRRRLVELGASGASELHD